MRALRPRSAPSSLPPARAGSARYDPGRTDQQPWRCHSPPAPPESRSSPTSTSSGSRHAPHRGPRLPLCERLRRHAPAPAQTEPLEPVPELSSSRRPPAQYRLGNLLGQFVASRPQRRLGLVPLLGEPLARCGNRRFRRLAHSGDRGSLLLAPLDSHRFLLFVNLRPCGPQCLFILRGFTLRVRQRLLGALPDADCRGLSFLQSSLEGLEEHS